MVKEPSVDEMRKALGLDACKPIVVSPSLLKQIEEENDPYRDWFEEELRAIYRQHVGVKY